MNYACIPALSKCCGLSIERNDAGYPKYFQIEKVREENALNRKIGLAKIHVVNGPNYIQMISLDR